MQEPSILFADEPTASLDPKSGQVVMELFAKLSKAQNLTLFLFHIMSNMPCTMPIVLSACGTQSYSLIPQAERKIPLV